MSDGEEWKGEEESSGYYSFFGGKPLTAEQREAYKRRAAEMKAKGDMLGALLAPLNMARSCPKCGHNKVKVQYCSGAESHQGGGDGCYPHTGNHEHMHRSCKRCYHVWYEKPLAEGDA